MDAAYDLDLACHEFDYIVLVQAGSLGYELLQSTFFSLLSWAIWLPWSVENYLRCSEQCCQLLL